MNKETISRVKINYPFLPLRDSIVFPHVVVPFYVGRSSSLSSIQQALNENYKLVVSTQKNIMTEKPEFNDIYSVGVMGRILYVNEIADGTMKIGFEALHKVRILDIAYSESHANALTQKINPVRKETKDLQLYASSMLKEFKQFLKRNENPSDVLQSFIDKKMNVDTLSYVMGTFLKVNQKDKQQILSQLDIKKRLTMIYECIIEEKKAATIRFELNDKVQSQISQTQRKHFLNEQLKVIQKELGDGQDDINDLIKKTTSLKMPPSAEKTVLKEIDRLKMMTPTSSEANILRNYIDWLHDIPWSIKTKDTFNIAKVEKQLNFDHYGLEKVKERIIEHVAVTQKVGKIKGPILCLVGPPGVGKTSLAQSVAKAMNRNFARISLGGIRDEAEIRGHRRTYIAAMPGKIMQKMKSVKSINPLILLDEVDKLVSSNMGDPSAALLEVLDPSQNSTFTDHYIELEYDLSNVLFFCTANSVQSIPRPLYDRMEIIQLSGYTELEKYHIFKQHLHKKITREHGLKTQELSINKSATFDLIRHYTKESGVRELERKFSKLCRRAVRDMLIQPEQKKYVIKNKELRSILGIEQYKFGMIDAHNSIGLVNGLAWSTTGGDVLKIEAVDMKGKGAIVLTGKLGDVMKESGHTALSYIRSQALHYNLSHIDFQKIDIHVHALEGAIPKDGPSAGIALTTAIISTLTNIPIRKDVAMTGEVSLRGTVLAIGGLKEKLLAAKRAGVSTVIIPQENEKDLIEMADEIKNGLLIKLVSNVDDAVKLALLYVIPEKDMSKNDDAMEERALPADDALSSTTHTIL